MTKSLTNIIKEILMAKHNKNRNPSKANQNLISLSKIEVNDHFGEEFKFAFKAKNILFGGMAHKYIYWNELSKRDLIINLYGTPVYNNNLVSCPLEFKSLFNEQKFHEICLRIPDGLFLWPQEYNLDFWEGIISIAEQLKIERIICCCFAGIGRTGTALAAMHMALNFPKLESHIQSIATIREHYYKKAIETNFQERYLENIFQQRNIQ